MSGGTLTAGAGVTIAKQGTFTQTGGRQNGGVVFINGRYNLLGGSYGTTSSFILGNGSADNGILLLDGGALTNTTTFYIGNSGRGTFILSNGVFSGNNMSFGDNGGTGAGGDFNIFGGNAR